MSEGVGRFRKKPVEIEAMRWDGSEESIAAICGWANGDFLGADDPTITYLTSGPGAPFDVRIWTLEGELHVTAGDWVIRGIKGEFYPCKPDIFMATYEPVGSQR